MKGGWDSREGLARLVIQADRARDIDGQQQEGAGDRHVLHEHDHLHLVGKIGVEQDAGQQGEAGQQERNDAGLPAEHDGESTQYFGGDHQRKHAGGYGRRGNYNLIGR